MHEQVPNSHVSTTPTVPMVTSSPSKPTTTPPSSQTGTPRNPATFQSIAPRSQDRSPNRATREHRNVCGMQNNTIMSAYTHARPSETGTDAGPHASDAASRFAGTDAQVRGGLAGTLRLNLTLRVVGLRQSPPRLQRGLRTSLTVSAFTAPHYASGATVY
jgi:hypothetical protein